MVQQIFLLKNWSTHEHDLTHPSETSWKWVSIVYKVLTKVLGDIFTSLRLRNFDRSVVIGKKSSWKAEWKIKNNVRKKGKTIYLVRDFKPIPIALFRVFHIHLLEMYSQFAVRLRRFEGPSALYARRVISRIIRRRKNYGIVDFPEIFSARSCQLKVMKIHESGLLKTSRVRLVKSLRFQRNLIVNFLFLHDTNFIKELKISMVPYSERVREFRWLLHPRKYHPWITWSTSNLTKK